MIDETGERILTKELQLLDHSLEIYLSFGDLAMEPSYLGKVRLKTFGKEGIFCDDTNWIDAVDLRETSIDRLSTSDSQQLVR